MEENVELTYEMHKLHMRLQNCGMWVNWINIENPNNITIDLRGE